MSAAEVQVEFTDSGTGCNHRFRLLDPCGRVVSQRECTSMQDAEIWLKLMQIVRKDPFLAIERLEGHSWISQSDPHFYCCD